MSYSTVAAPLFQLMRKDVPFVWGLEQDRAMDELKTRITSAPALVTIEYEKESGEVFIGTDASLVGWGGHLSQTGRNGRRHPSRFESGIWTPAQSKYDAGRRECLALVNMLKKSKAWVYRRHFIIKTDALILAKLINKRTIDVPGALMTRWIAFIQLFDFNIVHIPGKSNIVADALSRRPAGGPDDPGAQMDPNIEDYIDNQLDSISSTVNKSEDEVLCLICDSLGGVLGNVSNLKDCVSPWQRSSLTTSTVWPNIDTILDPSTRYSEDSKRIAMWLYNV